MPSSSLAQISSCKKYPGHEDFISLKNFTPKDCRKMQQNPKLYDLIKSQGALTLKIRSEKQKKLKQAEKSKSIVTTGFVVWVEKRLLGIGQSCQCSDCISKIVSAEHKEWYDFIIITGTFAVPSQAAANRMKLEFNFDGGQDQKIQILKGNCKYVKVTENICQLHCFTTDLELGHELKSRYVQFEGLVSNAFSLIKEDSEYLFSFTVSHPHGCEKHVSYSLEKDLFKTFGGSGLRFLEKNKGCVIWPSVWNYAKVLYQIPTCSGSSGAIVITLSRKNGIIISLHLSGSKRLSWVKERNVKHFSELLQPGEDLDQDEDTGPRVKFGTKNDGTVDDRKDQLAEANVPAPDGSVKVIPNRPIVRVISCQNPPPRIANASIKNTGERNLQHQPDQSSMSQEPVSVDQIPTPIEGEETVSQCQVDNESVSVDQIPTPIEGEETVSQCQVDNEAVSVDQIPTPIEGEETVSQYQVDKEAVSVDQIPTPIEGEETVLQCQVDNESVSVDQIPTPIEGEETVSQYQVDKEAVSVDQIPTPMEGEETVLQCQVDNESVSVDQIPTPIEGEETVSQYQVDKEAVSVDQIPTPIEGEETVSQYQVDKEAVSVDQIPTPIKESVGVPESEVCFGYEADMMLKYHNCSKNPGHENFFHFKELKIDNLPDGFRDENILNSVHDMGALTVKVSTSYVSRKRPEFHPHTGDPYLFHAGKGLQYLRAGTGFAVSTRRTSLRYGQACQCAECMSDDDAIRYDCYQVIIMTATHNVFDQAEANKTEIQFSYFMDSEEVSTKVLKGKCLHSVINEDVCWLEYCTHDETLIHALRKHIHQFQERSLNLSYQRKNDGFVVMVSHPHGTRKQHVSFGKVLTDSEVLSFEEGVADDASDAAEEKSKDKEHKPPAFQFYQPFDKVVLWPGDLFKPIVCQQFPQIYYTTPTCPGSSGALILVHQPGVGNVLYTHWGAGNHNATYNRSGGGTVFFLNNNQVLPD